MEGIIPIIFTLLIVVIILYLSFIASKYLANGTLKMNQSRYMKIIDKMVVGQNAMIAVIQLNNRYFLISVTSSDIHILKELEADDLILDNESKDKNSQMPQGFKDMLTKLMNQKKK